MDFFGEQLQKTGYSYHGNETMYSGISGEEMQATIFIGLVYYQRLRHMVAAPPLYWSLTVLLVHSPWAGAESMHHVRTGER